MAKEMQKPHNPYASNLKKEQDEVVLAYTPALRAMAFRLKERLPAHIDVSDLIGAGLEEMVKLSRKYDKEQNDSFWGYAQKRVYGAMLDFLRGLDVVSRSDRTLVKSIEALVNEYFNKFECEPDDVYIAGKLGIEVEKVSEARNVVAVLNIDDQMELMSEENTLERVEKEDLIEKITQILNEFEERDQLIVQLYYYEELSLKEISEILQITESRISQIHKRLMEKIRKKLEGK